MMIYAVVVAATLCGADPELEVKGVGLRPRLMITPNTDRILQGDNLTVRAVLHNPRDIPLQVEVYSSEWWTYKCRIQVRRNGKWETVNSIEEDGSPLCGGSGPRLIAGRSEYCEHNDFHRHTKAFIFDKVGKVELRALARTAEGELTSEPVTIEVGERPAGDLERIQAVGRKLEALEFASVQRTIPDEVRSLEDVGGNIAATLRAFLITQEYARSRQINGVHVSKDRLCETLKLQMDEVCYEKSLNLLVSHFVNRQDAEGLSYVYKAMPYSSQWRHVAERHLKYNFEPIDE